MGVVNQKWVWFAKIFLLRSQTLKPSFQNPRSATALHTNALIIELDLNSAHHAR